MGRLFIKLYQGTFYMAILNLKAKNEKYGQNFTIYKHLCMLESYF